VARLSRGVAVWLTTRQRKRSSSRRQPVLVRLDGLCVEFRKEPIDRATAATASSMRVTLTAPIMSSCIASSEIRYPDRGEGSFGWHAEIPLPFPRRKSDPQRRGS